MAVNICRDCKFWDEMRIRNRGTCRRFPSTIETASSHWCGEFQHSAQKTKVTVETAVLGEAVLVHEEPKKKGKRDVGTV